MLFRSGLKTAAVVVLWIWLARAETRLTAVALGLIIGGAVGNGIDRLAYGAVVDFVLFLIVLSVKPSGIFGRQRA